MLLHLGPFLELTLFSIDAFLFLLKVVNTMIDFYSLEEIE